MSWPGPAPRILHAELAEYRREIRDVRADAEKLVGGLSEGELNWKPSPEKWSVAQCLDHLNNAWKALPKFDKVIEAARRDGLRSDGPYRHPFLSRLYIRLVEPPPRIRVSAPRRYRPVEDQSIVGAVPRFLELQTEIIARIEAADGLDIGRIRMSSPITRRFRMSLGQWFAFLAAHERRHLWQAWQVRRHPEFPGERPPD